MYLQLRTVYYKNERAARIDINDTAFSKLQSDMTLIKSHDTSVFMDSILLTFRRLSSSNNVKA